MKWLGRRWQEVSRELSESEIEFSTDVTYPAGKVIPSGNMRVAKVSQVDTKLIFTLLHDSYHK